MRTAIIQIRKDDAAVLQEAGAAFVSAWHAGHTGSDLFTFASPSQLFSILSPRRWELIERLQALGAVSGRQLARELGRDAKRVHADAAVLLQWGLVERTSDGLLIVPYDIIHADFDLRAAA